LTLLEPRFFGRFCRPPPCHLATAPLVQLSVISSQFYAKTKRPPPLTRGGGNTGLRGARFVYDGRANEIAPFRPGAVVVAHLVEAQQILEHEPGVRAALADAAVSNDFILAVNALGFIELLQIVEGFEGAVFVGGLRPGNIGGLRNVTGALCGFGHARRRDDFAGEFIDGPNVDELTRLAALHHGRNVFLESADGRVSLGNAIGAWADIGSLFGERALLFEPFLAATVDQPNVFMAVELQLPKGVSGEPVVVVAINNDSGLLGNARSAEQLF